MAYASVVTRPVNFALVDKADDSPTAPKSHCWSQERPFNVMKSLSLQEFKGKALCLGVYTHVKYS